MTAYFTAKYNDEEKEMHFASVSVAWHIILLGVGVICLFVREVAKQLFLGQDPLCSCIIYERSGLLPRVEAELLGFS